MQVTDNNGCIGSATGVLTVNALPVVTVNSETICAGDAPATFTATSDSAAASYVWSENGTGNASSTSGSTAGNYTVQVTDNNGCIGAATGTLSVNAKPDITIADQAICAGDAAVIFDAGAGYSSYQWSGTGGSTSTAQTTSGTVSGTYVAEVTDANGCKDTATATLTVNAKPNITVADQAICAGDAAVIFDAGAGYSSYQWSGTGGSTASTQTTSGTSGGTYIVEVTDANGCKDTAIATLTVNSLPSVTLNDGAICPGSSLQFDAGAGFSYEWNDGSTNQTLSAAAAGQYFVEITDGNGCKARDTATVAMNSNLSVNLGLDQAVCQGESVNLSVVPSGFNSSTHTIAWSTGSSADAITVSTTQQVSVIVTDPQGCFGRDTIQVTVHPKPEITLTDQAICAGDPAATFDVGAGYTYQWSGDASGTNQTYASSVAGTFTVAVTDAHGCKDTTSATLTVNPLPSVILADRSICPGTSTTYDAGAGFTYLWQDGSTAQTYQSSTAEEVRIIITDANGCVDRDTATVSMQNDLSVPLGPDQAVCQGSTVTLDLNPLGYSSSTHTILWSTGASTESITLNSTQEVSVLVTDPSGCAGRDTVQVTVHSNPTITMADQSICQGDGPAVFDPGAGYVNYNWSGAWTGNTPTCAATQPGTYTVEVTDANGCKDTTAADLIVNNLPVVVLSNRSICVGTSTTFDAGAGYNYLWQDGSTNQTYTSNTAEEVRITITDGNGCQGSDTAQVNIAAGLAVDLGPDLTACQGNTFVLDCGYDAVNYTILWEGAAINGTSARTASIGTSGTYSVQVEDAAGCSGSDTVEVTINSNPIASLTDQSICSGDAAVQFDAGAGYTYQWSGDASGNNRTYSSSTSGIFTVEITDGNGCKDTASASLTVNSLPVVNLGIDRSMCTGSTVDFNAENTGATFLWHDGSSNQIYTSAAAETVHVLVTDANGCEGRDTAIVTIEPGLAVDLGPDQSICEGATATIDAGYDASANTVLWNTGASTRTISTTTSGTFIVVVTDAGGCMGTDTIDVIVNPNPAPSLSDAAICAGDPAVTFDPGTGAGWTYLWGGDASGSSRTYSSSTSGNFVVDVTDGNGCSGSAAASLVVNPLPVVSINDTLIVCPGRDTVFSTGGSYSTYEWNGNASNNTASYQTNQVGDVWLTVTDVNGCQNTATSYLANYPAEVVDLQANQTSICVGGSVTLTPTLSGAGYTYEWENGSTSFTRNVSPTVTTLYEVYVTSGGGCPAYDSLRIVVNPLPVVDVPDQSICEGQSATFDAQNEGATFLWSDGSAGRTLTVSQAGSYAVTVTDGNGCVNSDNATLTVNPLPSPSLSNLTICQGDGAATFDAGPGFTSYLWSGAGAGTNRTLQATAAGDYTVTVTNIYGCTQDATASLSVNSLPTISLGPDQVICQGQTATVNASVASGTSVLWNSGLTGSSITIDSTGLYRATVTDGNGCKGRDTMLLTVVPLPTFNKSNDTTVCFELIGNLALEVTTAVRNNVVWDRGDLYPEIEVTEAGQYPFTVTNERNCEARDTIVITEKCISTFFIPNAFSPDGDGTNDIFFGEGINIEDYEMYIFDRWGEEIFHTSDMHEGWDGTINGRPCQVDVYVYKIYYSTEEDHEDASGRRRRTKVGTVTLVR